MKKVLNGIWKLVLGIILFIVSFTLLAILTPWGAIETLIGLFYKKRFWKALGSLGELILLFAVILDVIGNVILSFPLNRILNTENGYKFGSRFDTISYVLGHGGIHGTLSKNGQKMCKFLNFFEKDHCVKTYNNRHKQNE